MIREFKQHLAENLEVAMIDEAEEVIGQIDPTLVGFGLDPDGLRFQGAQGNFRYTVFVGDSSPVAGGETSDGIWQQLAQLEPGLPGTIVLPGDRIGVGLRAKVAGQDTHVLVSTYPKWKNESQYSKILHEVKGEIWWVLAAIVMVVATALFATRQALLPLRALSEQARSIGPLAAGRRLEADTIPTEFVPVIEDVNAAFDRLEQGYRAQRDFSSNVAHEIRTPIAVLRSSIERIDEAALRQTLTQDAEQLDRIFNQLIDLARADTALMTDFTSVDLRALTADTAMEFASDAVRTGRSLSVTGAKTAHVRGHAGLLRIALGNLIRNALNYTAAQSEVEIEVLSNPAGWRVLDRGPGVPDALKTDLFERFNRGTQAHTSDTGSGLGLAIVKSVADCHNASVTIEDRNGGGSVFSFVFADD